MWDFSKVFDIGTRARALRDGVNGNRGALIQGLTGVDFTPGTNLRANLAFTPNKNSGGGGGGGGNTPQVPQISDQPLATSQAIYGTDGYGGVSAAQAAADEAERNALLTEIEGLSPRQQQLFAGIFDRIKQTANRNRSKINDQYNEQNAKYTTEYQAALPEIDNAFAAMGIGNSTYAGDRIDTATDEYKGSLAKSDKARGDELAAENENEQKNIGAFQADQKNVNDAISRSKGVKDVSELRDARNNLTTTLNNVEGKGNSIIGDSADAAARADSARSKNFEDAKKTLTGVLASAMDVGTKSAAKEALMEYSNLTDDEKRELSELEVNNPYGAPVA